MAQVNMMEHHILPWRIVYTGGMTALIILPLILSDYIQTGLFPIISSINIISVQIPEIILSRGVKVFVMDLTRKGIKTLNIAPLAETVLFIHQAELLLYAIYALFHLNI